MYNHLALPVTNLQESRKFYEQLGLHPFREWQKPEQQLQAIVMKNDAGFIVELVYHSENQVITPPPIFQTRHIGLEVTNLSQLISTLEQQGVTILSPVTKGASVKELAFIADPDGNVIELVVE